MLDLNFGSTISVIDKSLSGHCNMTGTCARDLDVLTPENGITLSYCPNQLRQRFFDVYKNNPEFLSVDAVLCLHATSLCELYMPFQKPLIIIASTRFDIGRYYDIESLRIWFSTLERIASNNSNILGARYNTIAANNMYDLQYIKYFTSIDNVLYLPSTASYLRGVRYEPCRPGWLVGPSRGVNGIIYKEMLDTIRNTTRDIRREEGIDLDLTPYHLNMPALYHIRDIYPTYEFTDLAGHRGIVLIPYQVSLMSFFEYYRMGIPIIAPSARLLSVWQVNYTVMNERTNVTNTPTCE